MNQCVITGVGLVTSLGQTADETFENIRNGKSGIKPLKRISTEGCYTNLGAEVPEVTLTRAAGASAYASINDTLVYQDISKPYSQNLFTNKGIWNGRDHKYYHLLGKALDDALADAHLTTKDITSNDILLNATCSGDADAATFRFDEKSAYSSLNDTFFVKNIANDTLELLKPTTMYFNYDKSITISTACSSGTVALAYARLLIESGKTERVVVMGSDIISDVQFSGFLSLKSLDEGPCKPFSNPNGLTLGDGAAAIVLESESSAIKRQEDWYCYLSGSMLSSEANHITSPDASGNSQAYTMEGALNDAGTNISNVDFIYTHGTGTPKNDEAESLAIEKLIKGLDKYSSPYVGSSKSAVGHTLGVSGLVNVALSSKMFQNHTLLPTVGFSGDGINNNINYIGNFETLKDPNIILCNSFAFGGNDASIVLSRKSFKDISNDIKRPNIEILGWDLYTNLYESVLGFLTLEVLPNGQPSLPSPSSFTKDGIDLNNLRKMDLYSRVKSVSGIRALKEAGVIVSNDNCYKIGILGGSETGSPTPMDKEYCENLAKNGNTWGNPILFPNSVYNAGDGWLSINTGIKGACISTINAIDSIGAYYTMADTLLESGKIDTLLLSYCNIENNGITCISVVLRATYDNIDIDRNWKNKKEFNPRPNQLITNLIKASKTWKT